MVAPAWPHLHPRGTCCSQGRSLYWLLNFSQGGHDGWEQTPGTLADIALTRLCPQA